MSIEQAIELLNRVRHRGNHTWELVRRVDRETGEPLPLDLHEDTVYGSPDPYDWLSAFEAIAIAEKYEKGES